MSDKLVRAISSDGLIKALAVSSREIVERAREIHHLSPLASAALGRVLSAASMMGSDLKDVNGSITIRIKGDGPLGTVMAIGECDGTVRGYLQHPETDLPLREDHKLDVGSGIGKGTLTVVKDLGMKDPYVGTTELIGGEIAEDLAAYFTESEQIPSACALGVLVDRDCSIRASGGYLIQLMPGATEETAIKLENRIFEAGAISKMLDRGMTPWEILQDVLQDFEPKLLEEKEVCYQCNCSRERVARALLSMGREELKELAEENPETEVTCQFCDRIYHFPKEELLKMASTGKIEK